MYSKLLPLNQFFAREVVVKIGEDARRRRKSHSSPDDVEGEVGSDVVVVPKMN